MYFRTEDGVVLESEHPQYHVGDVRLSDKDGKAAVKAQACESLRLMLEPGATICTILRHVAASGMSRSISLIIARDGEPYDMTFLAARAIGEPVDQKHGGIKATGCGMDMGYHLVYRLGCALWPHGTPTPHSTRNGEPDRDGGYALKHRWL